MRQERYHEYFEEYEVAAALYGRSDILKVFADDTKKHILLVDPMGHESKIGLQISSFLEEKTKSGEFGSSQNPAIELSKLSRLALRLKLPKFGASYVQLPRGDKILIANSALPFPFKFSAQNKSIFKITCVWGDYLPGYHSQRSLGYRIKLGKGDVLILTSDGVPENIESAIGADKKLLKDVRNQENEEIARKDEKNIGKKVRAHHLQIRKGRDKILYNFFRDNSKKSALSIVRTFIKTFGYMFIPTTGNDDDASIVVIKKY